MISKNLDLKAIKLSDIKENKGEKIESISKKDIAIIGISGRFPFAENINEFWENLREGKDCVREFPAYRREDADKVLTGRGILQKDIAYYEGAYFDDVDKFDYSFFRLSPKEAGLMDPNQRIFLEEVWKTIEAAGYGGQKLTGSRTGIYIGFSSDFGESYSNLIRETDSSVTDLALPGNIKSIIASRIAYLLDLKGPSITVDTACSSSLTAVHLACQGIRNGECELAIAGGIKVNLMPVKGLEEGLGIEATEGRAKTFDDSSDGTGFGEGVAVILLKPLKKAIEDNDFIHAVIKGSAVNQDGASVGITAPNSVAQQDVIVRAWKDAGINPENIAFIEAHGTGTKLGDPIEIEGMTMAFEKFTKKKQFCAVGSVKTNMGHPDHAAGIIGLAKAIMAIEHREIPPSLHFKKPNHKIDFANSPVYVNDRLNAWKGGEQPMRCGISSFGLSGTNCHMILEEYISDKKVSEVKEGINNKHVITLSAKSETALVNLIQNYLEFIKAEVQTKSDLEDFCYTANTGRWHYNYRLAFITESKADFLDKLQKVSISGLDAIGDNDIFYGKYRVVLSDEQKKTENDVTAKNIREFTEAANSKLIKLQAGHNEELLRELCSAYVRGGQADWELLYKGQNHKKAVLPVYPFEKKRCWFNRTEKLRRAATEQILHPLMEKLVVESMESDIFETVYSVDKHWVLYEHRVAGRCVVPGTTYLELAREIGKRYYGDSLIELKNILFLTPLIVDDGQEKKVQTIVKNKDNIIEFGVLSRETESGNWVKHAEGIISKSADNNVPSVYNLRELKQRLGNTKEIDYNDIQTDGVEGGPRFKNMQKIYMGTGEALAYLELPKEFSADLNDYLLHPALMDSAVNMANHSIGNGLYLPLSFKRFRIWGNTPSGIYSYLRKKSLDTVNAETASFDITILNDAGEVLVEVNDFTIKKVHEAEIKKMAGSSSAYYKIGWKQKRIHDRTAESKNGTYLVFKGTQGLSLQLLEKLQSLDKKVIEVEIGESFKRINEASYIIGNNEKDYNLLINFIQDTDISKILHMSSMSCDNGITDITDLNEALRKGVYSIFNLTRAMVNNKKNDDVGLYLISDMVNEVSLEENKINPDGAALFGLGKVIAEEYPKMRVRCIDIDENVSADDIMSELQAKETLSFVAYRNGIRYVEEFREAETDELTGNDVKIQENGVYIITGGLGGLGLEVSKYISSQKNVTLCLINRSGMPNEKEWDGILEKAVDKKLCSRISAIKQIRAAGSEVNIYSSDVSSIEKTEAVLNDIRKKYGVINGIIHCAGVAGDGFLIRKETNVFDSVLFPKVLGTWVLDNLTKNDSLDFFVLFSSISSIFGAEGQGDYTAANAYLDSYAAYRNKLGRRTLSINWPQWKEAGMAVDFGVSDTGLFKGITTNKAIQVLEELLGCGVARIIPGELNYNVIASLGEELPLDISPGIKKIIEKQQGQHYKKQPEIKNTVNHDVLLKGNGSEGRTDIEIKIAEAWGSVLGLSEIDINDNFYDMGGDSIRATRLLKELEKDFEGIIDISDIFTYPTISEMSGYIKSKTESKIERKTEGKAERKSTPAPTANEDIDAILGSIARGEISIDEAEKLMELGEKK
jgi:acyl transferase domain-containing protein/acyl carrier protein